MRFINIKLINNKSKKIIKLDTKINNNSIFNEYLNNNKLISMENEFTKHFNVKPIKNLIFSVKDKKFSKLQFFIPNFSFKNEHFKILCFGLIKARFSKISKK